MQIADSWMYNPYEDVENVHCPICDEECEEVYINRAGDVVGCDVCMSTQDANEWAYEQSENAKAEWEDRKFDEYRDRMLFDSE